MTAGYSTREVAKLLKMPEHRVRLFVRAGVVTGQSAIGAKELRFDFRAVSILKMANRLLQNGLPAKRVKRALVLLKRQIREERPLSGVKLYAEGARVVA